MLSYDFICDGLPDKEYVLRQLGYSGVLETTRFRRDGFAFHIHLAGFLNQYVFRPTHPIFIHVHYLLNLLDCDFAELAECRALSRWASLVVSVIVSVTLCLSILVFYFSSTDFVRVRYRKSQAVRRGMPA